MIEQIKERIEQIKRGVVPNGYKKTSIGIVPSDWEVKKFKTQFYRITRKNIEGNCNVLTISAQHGLINQEDFFNKCVASEDKSNYYLIHKGEFAYNKSYSNGYPYGALKSLILYDKGVVSPLYICFARIEENCSSNYYSYYFEQGLMNKEIQVYAQEGARSHGLLNIRVEDFFNSNILVPKLAEQEKIVEILVTNDKVIELKEKLISEKQKQKQYLMQQLLTGKKRLDGFDEKWEKYELGEIFDYLQPTQYIVRSTDYSDKYITPVLTAGKKFILGYTNEYDNIFIDIPVVIFDDFTTASKFVDFPFKVKSSAMKILKCKNCIDIKFAYSAMKQIKHLVGGHERHWISKYSLLIIKIPSLKEQKAIADIISCADQEIKLLKEDLKLEKLNKKSLMQLLLTGTVRVN